ncbi:hypothetical protein LEP3755_01590 [Leptolyngbya sp. NIES-3755]|nr:hypothetical protein LEP3755_01590 [Leptolyngbya sp. NIES-3755]
MSDTPIAQPPKTIASKPIAYYLSDAEDAENLSKIALDYGDRLEGLSEGQKISLLTNILAEIWDRPTTKRGYCPPVLTQALKSLSTDTLLGLLTATAEQLRHDQPQEESLAPEGWRSV